MTPSFLFLARDTRRPSAQATAMAFWISISRYSCERLVSLDLTQLVFGHNRPYLY